MGLFNRNDNQPAQPLADEPMTVEERAEVLREYAIEYITSLSKADKEKFTEAVDLIWQGRTILSRVKTTDEKAYEKEAKASGMTTEQADDLGFDFLEDEPQKANPIIDDKPKTGKSVDGVSVKQ